MVEFEGQMISEDELNAAMSQAMEQSKSVKFEKDMEIGASIAAKQKA
jgi:hypothetical protein